jgi:hypothetical protein
MTRSRDRAIPIAALQALPRIRSTLEEAIPPRPVGALQLAAALQEAIPTRPVGALQLATALQEAIPTRPVGTLQLAAASQEAIPTSSLAQQRSMKDRIRELETTLRNKDDEICEGHDALISVLRYYGTERAAEPERARAVVAAHARQAGRAPKQKITAKHSAMIEEFVAEKNRLMESGARCLKRDLYKMIAEKHGVSSETVARAVRKAGL